MKREEVKQIFTDATDEQLNAIMKLNGNDIEKIKSRAEKAEHELQDKRTEFEKLSNEFETLKSSNATAEDYKAKFEALQKDVKEKETTAEKERAEKEKAKKISERFDAVIGDKKFSHEAIKRDYLRRFGEAVESEENIGKSDADIFHELTKDDKTAFSGVTAINLMGGNPAISGTVTKQAFTKMSYREKAELYQKNPVLYNSLKEE